MKYSIKIGAIKVLKSIAIFAIPVLVDQFILAYPWIAQLTIGGILVGIANYVKVNNKIKDNG